MTLWIALALLIIVVLGGYAGYLHWLLRQQKRRRTQPGSTADSATPAVHIFEPPAPQRTVVAEKAVYLLAEALLDDKLTHTEGCIRIAAMAAGLPDYQGFQREYAVFFQVAEATAHLPILDAWRALGPQEQKSLERERLDIEERYRPAVVAAAQQLKTQWRDRRHTR